MTDRDTAYAAIADIAPRIAAGDLSPVALTEHMLTRIEQHDGALNSFITVMASSAREAARTAEAEIAGGRYRGPLHGVPVAVKDLFATDGVKTTFGTLLYKDWVPDFDASVVERLKAAGAVIVGKTNLHELAFGTTSVNPHYGAVRNPWNTDCHTGGSSGGSAAAVAAGLAYGALGSDTGASIRQPAHCCGIVGIKGTFGRVPKYGGLPLSWSMDHAGPMTRSVRDAAIMLQALAGRDPRDPSSSAEPVDDYLAQLEAGIDGLRIGVPREYFFDNCEAGVAARVEDAIGVLRRLGARVGEIALPDMHATYAAGSVIMFAEAWACYRADYQADPNQFSPEVQATLDMGSFYTADHLLQAQRLRRHMTQETVAALAGYDAMVMPTCPVATTPIADTPPEHTLLRVQNTQPFDTISLPAISLPCGFTGDGRPVGLQIVGKPFDEAGVLRVARAYEDATEWHLDRPADF
jgi:aspartyl-tRNA(Asn)/glutamyl-tRNA(Gln) amidotransferase subunit A